MFRKILVVTRGALVSQLNKSSSRAFCSETSVTRKWRSTTKEYSPPEHWSVSAFATAESYHLHLLVRALKEDDSYVPLELTNHACLQSGVGSALHAVAKHSNNPVDPEDRHVYFFQDGTVVMWNFDSLEMDKMLWYLKGFSSQQYDTTVSRSEVEVMDYTYDQCGKKSTIRHGQIVVATNGRTIEDIAADKYTLSNALALSVKLGVIETLLMNYIESIRPVTEDLKFGRPLTVTQSGVLKLSGQVFAMRHSVNLSTDLLDTPDFYWDRENLEGLFNYCHSYFSISKRTKVVNDKLDHCLGLIQLVSTHLSDRHHVRLEWMIIILIMVEVGFEFVHKFLMT